jgi:hypothetical protein
MMKLLDKNTSQSLMHSIYRDAVFVASGLIVLEMKSWQAHCMPIKSMTYKPS